MECAVMECQFNTSDGKPFRKHNIIFIPAIDLALAVSIPVLSTTASKKGLIRFASHIESLQILLPSRVFILMNVLATMQKATRAKLPNDGRAFKNFQSWTIVLVENYAVEYPASIVKIDFKSADTTKIEALAADTKSTSHQSSLLSCGTGCANRSSRVHIPAQEHSSFIDCLGKLDTRNERQCADALFQREIAADMSQTFYASANRLTVESLSGAMIKDGTRQNQCSCILKEQVAFSERMILRFHKAMGDSGPTGIDLEIEIKTLNPKADFASGTKLEVSLKELSAKLSGNGRGSGSITSVTLNTPDRSDTWHKVLFINAML
ncbi:hypothetical protein BJ741DRAFT_674469 [Chytriomyces cf. hyalinus JEL632]|nr:hypothetical protein BJ741DRAFT_674469 [Chytriomyces cf. hyalinus JEL632]